MEHDDAIKWKHFPRNWPFVRRIHRSRWIPHTKASDAELWCFLLSAWINDWVNNRQAGDLRRHCGHYDVNVMRIRVHVVVSTIIVTSLWERWRLKSPASLIFTQPFIQAQIKENIKALRQWPLWGEFTGDRWIPRTKGLLRGKKFPFDDVTMRLVNSRHSTTV